MTAAPVEPVVGLEIHAQVRTQSKMFCSCSAAYSGAAPNTHVCEVCSGMPGSLPATNARAVEGTVLTSLALNCDVPRHSKFDRKNYSYPDLPKGFQITQYDLPIGRNGWLEYDLDGDLRRCGIVRVHLEEDTGKSIHTRDDGEEDVSLIDLNRSGVPLMEIVTEPDLRSSAEARAFFSALRQVLMYLGVNDGNLQEGSLRADVNVSVRTAGGDLGTKVEIKNLNSFRAVERAIAFEIERQARLLASGEPIEQETRGWSERDEVTVGQRSKEHAHDYRYFPEPDLPPLDLAPEFVSDTRARLPELPLARGRRLEREYGLSREVVSILLEDRSLAEFYESALEAPSRPTPIALANWLRGEVLRLCHDRGERLEESKLAPDSLAGLVTLVEEGQLSATAAKEVLEQMFASGGEPLEVARRLDKLQITDEDELTALIETVLSGEAELIAQYRAGKTKVLQVLIGRVMKTSRGKAAPKAVEDLLSRALQDSS